LEKETTDTRSSFTLSGKLRDYMMLIKFSLSFMVVFSAVVSFLLVPRNGYDFKMIVILFIGGLLVTGSANAINQVVERDTDAMMKRTAKRPVASGRMSVAEGWGFAIITGILGIAMLWYFFNMSSAMLAAFSLFLYAFIYTPLKKVNSVSVLVGAFPGAIPPLIGWAAATGTVSLQALAIYAILFLWQFPHFMAIAWMYREDYARAGYLVLPCENQRRFVAWFTALPTLGLVILSLAPTPLARAGLACRIGVLLLSSGLVYCGAQLGLRRSTLAARRLLLASIVYLPLVFVLRVADRLLGRS